MSLEKLIESYYAPKKGNELLVQLIESKLNERFGGIKTGERINIKSGEAGTEAYREFQTLFSGVIKKDELLGIRLAKVNKFLLADKSEINQISINQAFSSILFVQELKEALEKLEASSAGFQMETIVAQLLQGSKLANDSIVDVEVRGEVARPESVDVEAKKDDFIKDFSIKTLKYDSLEIKGSFLNLCEKFASLKGNETYEYLIITKNIGQGIYKFYEWVMPYENFFEQIIKPKGFLNPGVLDGKFIFKDGVDFAKFQELGKKGIKVGRTTYNLTKKIYKETDKDGKEIFFIKIPVIEGEQSANNIFSQLQQKGAVPQGLTPAQAMVDRFKNLKFVENTKDYFQNADALEVGTQFSITQKIIKQNIQQEGSKIAEFDLSDTTLKAVEEKYQNSLVGKMNQILKDNEEVLKRMNEYFATHNKQSAESALENMTKVRRGFRQFSSKLTPNVVETETES